MIVFLVWCHINETELNFVFYLVSGSFHAEIAVV